MALFFYCIFTIGITGCSSVHLIDATMKNGREIASESELVVLCKRNERILPCTARTLEAFQKLNCKPIEDSLHCNDAVSDPTLDPSYKDKMKGYDFCKIQSSCDEPSYGNFGGISCKDEENFSWVNLKDVDKGITLTTSTGLFQRRVTKMCKPNL